MTVHINPQTKKVIDATAAQAHAIILAGSAGVGLATIAHDIAKTQKKLVYSVLPEKDEKVDAEKGTITVQSIRKLYDLTKTKEPNGRIIVIDYAERMGIPAQNAFLKLLEEPVEGTQFMLLTHDVRSLLPTILSRSQLVTILPISVEQSQTVLDELKVLDATKRAQLLFIASGKPAELTRLAQNDELFETRAQIVKDARAFVTGAPYQRLRIAMKYKSDRPGALLMIEDASKMVRASIADSADAKNISMLARLEGVHKRIFEQGNIRLQLSAAGLLQ